MTVEPLMAALQAGQLSFGFAALRFDLKVRGLGFGIRGLGLKVYKVRALGFSIVHGFPCRGAAAEGLECEVSGGVHVRVGRHPAGSRS